MSFVVTSDEYLEIDRSSSGDAGDWLPLHCPAWVLTEITMLWQGASQRGGDGVRIPGAHGARPTPAWRDETEYVLPLTVFGDKDTEGNPMSSSSRTGVEENILLLQELEEKPTNEFGTRGARLHRPSGVYVADLTVLRLTFGAKGAGAVRGALTVRIPAGRFVPDPGSV